MRRLQSSLIYNEKVRPLLGLAALTSASNKGMLATISSRTARNTAITSSSCYNRTLTADHHR